MQNTLRRCVVVIDDNCDAADIISMFLEMDGHEVHTAYSGAAGVAAVEASRPAYVFCDIGMPEVDGYRVAESIRKLGGDYHPYLVATTGWGDALTRQKTSLAGFDLHLVKPVSLAEVKTIVEGAS